jgi:hypothetical protein
MPTRSKHSATLSPRPSDRATSPLLSLSSTRSSGSRWVNPPIQSGAISTSSRSCTGSGGSRQRRSSRRTVRGGRPPQSGPARSQENHIAGAGGVLSWLSHRWDGWRLPILFLEVKAAIGCRITELAAVPRTALEDGRITFHAQTAKGRKTRRCKVPASLFAELSSLPGDYVWESFSDNLRDIHRNRGRHDHAKCVRAFTPKRMVAWLEDQQQVYFAAHPGVRRFKLHNFRGLAMTRAKELGGELRRCRHGVRLPP